MDFRRKHIKPRIRKLRGGKGIFQRPLFWVFSAVLLTTGIGLYFALFYSKFQVEKIDVLGNQKIMTKDIEDIALAQVSKKILNLGFFNLSTKSIFTVDSKNLVENLLNKFPLIEEVKLQKKMPQGVILEIKERGSFALFCQNENRCFFMDKNGVIFEESQVVVKDMVIIKKDFEDEVFLGQNIISKKEVDIIVRVEKNLKDNFQIGVEEIYVSENLLTFKTLEGWQIYFDSTSDIDLQITKMNVLLKEEIPANARKKLQYIYLQYKDKAYYK